MVQKDKGGLRRRHDWCQRISRNLPYGSHQPIINSIILINHTTKKRTPSSFLPSFPWTNVYFFPQPWRIRLQWNKKRPVSLYSTPTYLIEEKPCPILRQKSTHSGQSAAVDESARAHPHQEYSLMVDFERRQPSPSRSLRRTPRSTTGKPAKLFFKNSNTLYILPEATLLHSSRCLTTEEFAAHESCRIRTDISAIQLVSLLYPIRIISYLVASKVKWEIEYVFIDHEGRHVCSLGQWPMWLLGPIIQVLGWEGHGLTSERKYW